MKRTRLIKAIETLEAAVNLIEKCGGPGGKPGPCPKPRPPGTTPSGSQKKPPRSSNSKKNPPKSQIPKKRQALDKKGRLRYSSSQLASAGMSLKGKVLTIAKPKSVAEANLQLEIMGAILDRAISLNNVAKKLPEGHSERLAASFRLNEVLGAHRKVVKNIRRFVDSLP